ncbi:MAG TPA: PAS domain S-box protein, partial [Acidobacteriota bacterium]|nr:PAS domain S-box protein [Acidobacteriota bacterium]
MTSSPSAFDSELEHLRQENARLQAIEQMLAVLQEQENLFLALANTSPVMVWMSGADGKSFFFNDRWLSFRGRTINEERGDGWLDGVHPDDAQHCFDIYLRAFRQQQEFEIEYRLQRADGEYRWVLDIGRPHYVAGSFAGYVGSCIDITDRKQTERWEAGQKDILELITKNAGLDQIFHLLIKTLEDIIPGMIGSILLL